MNLIQLRTEVLAHGFDPVQYGSRVNQYLNDALSLIARRADYYADEGIEILTTTAGGSIYTFLPLPAGSFEERNTAPTGAPVARIRSVYDPSRTIELQWVSQRQIDRSSNVQGPPTYYAVGYRGALILYPTPDAVYSLRVRVWYLPSKLVNDTDVPLLPEDWHKLLWYYAVAECYAADDDMATGAQWMQKFTEGLAEFEADQKFPASDGPSQASDMWGGDDSLGSSNSWSLFGV